MLITAQCPYLECKSKYFSCVCVPVAFDASISGHLEAGSSLCGRASHDHIPCYLLQELAPMPTFP